MSYSLERLFGSIKKSSTLLAGCDFQKSPRSLTRTTLQNHLRVPGGHFWQASQASDLHELPGNLRFYRNLRPHLLRPFPGRSSESHLHDPVSICTPRHQKSRRSDGVLRRPLSQVGATSYATVRTRSESRQPNRRPPESHESRKALHVLPICLQPHSRNNQEHKRALDM